MPHRSTFIENNGKVESKHKESSSTGQLKFNGFVCTHKMSLYIDFVVQ